MNWIGIFTHLCAFASGLILLHRFGHLFQTGRCPLLRVDIVEAIYLAICASTLLCPIAIYDLLMTAAQKSAITWQTLAYLMASGAVFTVFHLISYKTMERVEHDGRRWRVV